MTWRRKTPGLARTWSFDWRASKRRKSYLVLSCVMLTTSATQGAFLMPRSVLRLHMWVKTLKSVSIHPFTAWLILTFSHICMFNAWECRRLKLFVAICISGELEWKQKHSFLLFLAWSPLSSLIKWCIFLNNKAQRSNSLTQSSQGEASRAGWRMLVREGLSKFTKIVKNWQNLMRLKVILGIFIQR